MRRLPLVAVVLLLAPAGAHAEPAPAPGGGPGATAPQDGLEPPRPGRASGEERPFVFLADPSTPARRDFALEYGVGVVSTGGAARPLPSVLGGQGVGHMLGAAYGASARLAPFAAGYLQTDWDSGATRGAGSIGLRWQITAPGSAFRLGLAAALLRDFGGAYGAWARLAGTYDLGRVRLAGNLHAERIFAGGRDAIDLLAMAGVSVRTTSWLRVGLEYVGQDLEDAFERHEVEGGAQHYAGPTVALDLDRGRVQIVAGPALGLNPRAARVVGRAAVVLTF